MMNIISKLTIETKLVYEVFAAVDWHRAKKVFDSEDKAKEIAEELEAFGGLEVKTVEEDGKWHVELKLVNPKKKVSFEFKTKKQMEDYLKKHPKADKSRHWVKGEKKETKKEEVKEEKKEETKQEPKKEEITKNVKDWKSKVKDFASNTVKKIKDVANTDVGKILEDFVTDALGVGKDGWGGSSDDSDESRDRSRSFAENMNWNRDPIKLMNLMNSGFGMRRR